ncbi:GNAT family N-acetyltransferase [Rickettsiales bacterium]|nr:GNAT family N-acetyltransferase [Rickettsiales bacterium]
MITFIQTKRLILRSWKKEDLEPFAKLNACKYVCEFLPKPLIKSESDNLAERIIAHFDKHGFGLYAVERKDNGKFIGFTGLSIPIFEAHFMPAVEIGWRLSYENWGQGFATEAALAVRDYAFEELGLNEIVSFTAEKNASSRRVMEKIGMQHDKVDDFDHPSLPSDHPLQRHVLYRLKNSMRKKI